jgi:hypothetical protein
MTGIGPKLAPAAAPWVALRGDAPGLVASFILIVIMCTLIAARHPIFCRVRRYASFRPSSVRSIASLWTPGRRSHRRQSHIPCMGPGARVSGRFLCPDPTIRMAGVNARATSHPLVPNLGRHLGRSLSFAGAVHAIAKN